MSNLLALDCTDRACSVAVKSGSDIAEIYLDEQRLHARHLLGLIQDCLRESGLQKTDLDAVVWARGPGSFTGLRIAAACVQGLCFGLSIPAIGVSSLLSMALRAKQINPDDQQRVWVGIDAKMGEIYTASYAIDFGAAQYRLVEEERLLSAANLELPEGFDTYLGSALDLVNAADAQAKLSSSMQIHAADLLRLPPSYLKTNSAGDRAEPIYLRKASAWQKMTTP